MRISSKGQVTIPEHIRERLGLLPNTRVTFVVEGDSVRIIKLEHQTGETRGQGIVNRLRGRAGVALTTDEIMAHTRDA